MEKFINIILNNIDNQQISVKLIETLRIKRRI
jgi:hypothetical protein